MNKVEFATQWMIDLANDDSHGYDQIYRWGQYGDYDCSAAVITAWETAGVPVKTNGATYTGNMKNAFINSGFINVTSSIELSKGTGLLRGDVLLKSNSHTAMYIGNGKIVHASNNEKGTASGGKSGDQTGKEICIRSYYNKPWDCILRYIEYNNNPTQNAKKIVQAGQLHVNKFANLNISADGVRGPETKKAGIKVLQTAINLDYNAGLVVDGVWGTKSKKALGSHYVKFGEKQYMVTAAEILLMLQGYDPKGVEYPGTFGSGLKAAINTYKKANNLPQNGVCDSSTFLLLIK
ncbi:peptidoglycan-binding protein [Ruminiclostridium herbifermentans]|uniref:Peptidoglycan-binding protein n=1 Tax=Ruminiclostridium herbifermentans TaxID=2488810 RepID=A0A4U7JLI6_9FIRM|nr:peptidoglycan-binding protein [Ruminiclostridium herbifermentans]QNU66108.1 peptidoglycan-binding protein [Ruminiclostridium herbifermentans]